MSADPSTLVPFSDALSRLVETANAFTARVYAGGGTALSGVLWREDAVVVSEQALPDETEYEAAIGDRTLSARLCGRDPGTNVAILKLASAITHPLPPPAIPKVGALAVIAGRGETGMSARLAIVRAIGNAWQSLAGGTIDRLIILDSPIARSEEGGPVLAADGAIYGMSTRGAARRSLVIPASTVERAARMLLETGSVRRGWLGVSLKPVALPEPLKPSESQRVGLMVMAVDSGSPAAEADILVGDILLTAGGAACVRYGTLTRQLGPDSIGTAMEIKLARAGTIVSRTAMIAERPSQ